MWRDFLIWLRDVRNPFSSLLGWIGDTVGYYFMVQPVTTVIAVYAIVALFCWFIPPLRKISELMMTGALVLPVMLVWRGSMAVLSVFFSLLGRMGVASANNTSEYLMNKSKRRRD